MEVEKIPLTAFKIKSFDKKSDRPPAPFLEGQ